MTSALDSTGLNIESNADIIADLILAMQTIYGPDINVESNSPDGQLIHVFAQAVTDMLELLLATYNLGAVPTSYGTRLDQLVALNGLFRKQGTYTEVQVDVVATGAVTLPGLDQTAQTPFTVADNEGNQFLLEISHVFSIAATATLTFRALAIGQVETTPNTITNIITATLLVPTVNNPTVAGDIIGTNEETDSQLKIRHDQSFNLAQTGPSDAMESALRNIPDVIDAFVVENDTGSSVGGVPAHTVWPIINGGTPSEIGQAIYSKKGPGCGMKGSQSIIITRPNGQTFTAQWDIAIAQPLYIKFGIIWRGAPTMADADIETAIAEALVFKLGQSPNIGDVQAALAAIAPTAIMTLNSATQGVSADGSAWASVVAPTTAQNYYTVVPANVVIS